MTRITPAEHYQRYQFLHTAWIEFPQLYQLLTLHQQWQLHDFYQPSIYLTKAELTKHIKVTTKQHPALVHQAGKHFHTVQRVFQAVAQLQGRTAAAPTSFMVRQAMRGHYPITPAMTEPDKHGRYYTVRAIARPEMDVEMFAKALVALVQQDSPKDMG